MATVEIGAGGVRAKADGGGGTFAGRATGRRRKPSWARWPIWMCTGFVALLVLTLTGFLNPDWFGYQIIFEGGDDWLTAQGRDPLFVWLCQLGVWLFTTDGYNEFRLAVGTYFVFFTWLLCSGRVLVRPLAPHHQNWRDSLTMLMMVLLFTSTRFAIQIREGLAMTLILFGLRQCQLGGPRSNLRAFAWFSASLMTHAGTALLMLALVLSMLFGKRARRVPRATLRAISRMTPVMILLGALTSGWMLNAASKDSLVQEFYGGIGPTASDWLYKLVYWSAMAWATWWTSREARWAHSSCSTSVQLRLFVELVTQWLLPAVCVCIIGLLAGQGPLTLVAAMGRLLQMMMSLMIIMTALQGRYSRPMLYVTAILIADQVRVVSEAISTTYSTVL